MCNFAPPDMVGHTGSYEAAIKGVEATDMAIGIIYEACKANNYTLVITADHGNAEQMLNYETGEKHTAHTSNPVPLIVASNNIKLDQEKKGALCDVAPTILDIMGIPIPPEMTGVSLKK
jgi:2,3-bisphosphoglycerate-independent phosphoglycerate mutase